MTFFKFMLLFVYGLACCRITLVVTDIVLKQRLTVVWGAVVVVALCAVMAAVVTAAFRK